MTVFDFQGLAGCVKQRETCATGGRPVSLYFAPQADMCCASGNWATVCEAHGSIQNHRTREIAEAHYNSEDGAQGWCEDCRVDAREESRKAELAQATFAESTGTLDAATADTPIKMTCPCCFRMITATSGKMAHHGFRRRQNYSGNTASCAGIRFSPLERSSEGLRWLVEMMERKLMDAKASLAAAPALQELARITRRPDGSHVMDSIKRDAEEWTRAYRDHVGKLESEIWSLDAHLPALRDKLSNWRPAGPSGPAR